MYFPTFNSSTTRVRKRWIISDKFPEETFLDPANLAQSFGEFSTTKKLV